MSDPVCGVIGYVAPMTVYPTSSYDPAKRNMKYDWREVPIHDAHEIPGGATLERHGFTTLPCEMSEVDLDAGEDWGPGFTREAVSLIQRMTGASDVVPSPPRGASTKYSGPAGTIDFCHNDYTGASIGTFVVELDPAKAEARLARRFAVYNIWRLISPLPQSRPLAICDASSVAAADVVPSQTHYTGDIYRQNALFRYNPAHRWYYYPNMRKDEILVWAGYDSDPRFPSLVPHVAFDDPTCTDPKAYRSNIDMRLYVFFDD
jgi:hypothetical protein